MKESNQQLSRSIGLFAAITLVVGSMIGSGIFKKVAPMSEQLMSPNWVLMAWAAAGIITWMGALTNAEVAGLIDETGGQYAYFRKMYGRFFAFIFGWASFSVIQTATGSSVAYVFGESVNSFITLPRFAKEYEEYALFGIDFIRPLDNFGVKLVTIGLLVLLTTVNYVGVKYGGGLTAFLASIIVICIFCIIIAVFALSGGSHEHLAQDAAGYTGRFAGQLGFFGVFILAMREAFWAYEGWNTVGFLGGEIKNPKRNIPLALTFGVIVVVGIYLLTNYAYFFGWDIDQYIALQAQNNELSAGLIPAIELIRSFLGNGGALMISILILLSTFNSTNTTIMGAPRIYFAMAQDKLFPQGLAKVHPKYKTPSNSLILQCVWGSVLVITGSFDMLTTMLVFAAFIFYGAGAIGVFVLRVKMKEVPRSYKVWGYPVVPALFSLFSFILVVVAVIEDYKLSLIGLGLIALGIPFYFLWNRKSA